MKNEFRKSENIIDVSHLWFKLYFPLQTRHNLISFNICWTRHERETIVLVRLHARTHTHTIPTNGGEERLVVRHCLGHLLCFFKVFFFFLIIYHQFQN